MLTDEVMFVVLATAALAVAAVVLWGINRAVRTSLAAVGRELGGPVQTGGLFAPHLEGRYRGVAYRVGYEHGSQYSSPKIHVEYRKGLGFSLTFRQEDADTRISKKIGIAKEVTVDAPEFDERFFITSSDPDKCRRFLSSAEARRLITDIYEAGLAVNFRDDSITVTITLLPRDGKLVVANPASRIDPKEVAKVLAMVEDLYGTR